ncbi:MAG: LacI family DNA-binding transcriptional regulator [Candidatus Eiseniibacteriota bacterium]
MARSKVTINDVAKAVGVHPSTVSRVLNPGTRHMVTAEIARRVGEAAEKLGYHPNALAHGLRTHRSRTIGVLIPDITNPVFPPILRGIEDALAGAGYIVIIANTDGEPERDRMILDRMLGRRVDGLILATARRKDPMVDRCLAEDVPVVLINRSTASSPKVAAVINDDATGIGLTVAHLAGLGHKRIAHVAGPQRLSTGYDRRRGFIEAMKAARLKPDPALIATADAYTEREGQRALSSLLDRGKRFTAVVAANDLLALGCYDALAAHGLACPKDVSVTGFNDMPFVDKLNPPLTTVRIQHYEMGVQAAKAMLEQLRDPGTGRIDIRLEPALVVRGSTARPS